MESYMPLAIYRPVEWKPNYWSALEVRWMSGCGVTCTLFGIASTTLMHHSSQISRNLSGWRSPMITTDATEERMWRSLCWQVTLWFNTYIAIVKVTSTRLQLSLISATNPSGKWCPMISADVTSSTFPHLLQSVRQNLLHESDHCTWR